MVKPAIPRPLQKEHEALHAELAAAKRLPGRVGAAARAVARLLHRHFEKEEAWALPPLGLLGPLARGRRPAGMGEALAMTERLAAELPAMLAEHKAIVAALRTLERAARAEKQPAVSDFARRLVQHARTEEEVLYPAAVLVGRYLRATATAEPSARRPSRPAARRRK